MSPTRVGDLSETWRRVWSEVFDELPDALLDEVPGDVFGDCSPSVPARVASFDLTRRHVDFVLVDKIEGPFSGSRGKASRVLRERLAGLGHAPRFGHELTGCEHDGEGVTARLAQADGTTATVRVRCLAGADGGRRSVRKRWRSTSPASR